VTWHHLPQQQQRGVRVRRPGEPPADAVAGREAQDHETADIQTSPTGEPDAEIDYPADPIERRTGDNTPSAPRPRVEWDTIVEPERVDERDNEGD
jgi:hypothetical protein